MSIAPRFLPDRYFFPPEDFPSLNNLQNSWQKIAEEVQCITKVSDLKREQKEWENKESMMFLEKIGKNEAWFYSWDSSESEADGKNNWLNYPLMYEGYVVGNARTLCPFTCSLLTEIRSGIRLAGFSRLKAGTKIYPHRDSTGIKTGRLAFHLGLSGRAFMFMERVDGNLECQRHEPSATLVANTEESHFIENPYEEDRVILYIDFDINKFYNKDTGYTGPLLSGYFH